MKKRIIKIIDFIRKKLISMKLVLAAVIIMAAVIPLVILRGVITEYYEKSAISSLIVEAQNRCNLLSVDIGKQNYFSNQINDNVSAQIEQITYSYSGRMLLIAPNHKVIKDTYVVQENKIIVSPEVNKAFRGNVTIDYVSEEGYVELTMPVYESDSKKILGVMVLTCSDSNIISTSARLYKLITRILELTFILALVFAIMFSWFLCKPINKLAALIKGITSGYLDNRIEVNKGFSEVREVSTAVNKMLERLKTLDDSRQEFVSNVSHELKTPITSIKVLADSLNSQEDVPVELYKEFMQDIAEEIDRENNIINDLLSLVRMDKTSAELNISTQNINELAEYVLKRLKPIAAEKNIELVLESFRPVVAEVDEVKLTLVITNLVENAIKYNIANGWVRVSVNADHKFFFITVADSGIGIPQDSVDKVFERFYRVDKARARMTGGTGLGLAITKSAIIMHKGAIKVHSKEGEGSTFTVRIPLTHTK